MCAYMHVAFTFGLKSMVVVSLFNGFSQRDLAG